MIYRILRAIDLDDFRWLAIVILTVALAHTLDGQWELERQVRELRLTQYEDALLRRDLRQRVEELELERLDDGEDRLPTKHLWGTGSMCVDLRIHEAQ